MKEWTIMVYMAGDNNLSEDMITGLKGMMSIGDQANINLVALYDGCYPVAPIKFYEFSKSAVANLARGNRPRLQDFEEKIYRQERSVTGSGTAGGTATVTQYRAEMGREDSDLFKLNDFVPRVIEKYPANRYALILSGHADGVIGKQLLRDEDPEIALDLTGLREILEGALPKNPDGNVRKLDLIGFDGCLMGMLEVGCELKGVAKVMVASEGNIPAAGWAYQEILDGIKESRGKMDEKQFAISIVQKYARFNEDFAISGRAVNISACNLDELNKDKSAGQPDERGSLFDIVQDLADILYKLLSLPIEVGDGVSEEVAVENKLIQEKFIDWMLLSHLRSQTFMHGQAVDIIDFTYNLLLHYPKWLRENEITGILPGESGSERTVNQTVSKIQDRIGSIFENFIGINEAIRKENKKYILASCSVGAEYQFSQGVSMFFPWTKMALNMIKKRYSSLIFNRTTHWLDFITRFSDLTLREKREKPLFNKDLPSLFSLSFDELRHKEVGGREVGGREVGGREVGGRGGSEGFYAYFSQIRNYRADFFERNCIDESSFI
jgi:hypothetical protein